MRDLRPGRGLGDGSVAVRTPAPSSSGGSLVYTTPGGTTIRPAASGIDSTAIGIAQQLRLLDTAGTFKAGPAPCSRRWATLTYTCAAWPSVLTTSAMLYEQARSMIRDLAARALPTDPAQRRAYYSAVVNYAWLMTWASNIEGADLVAMGGLDGLYETTPSWSFYGSPINVRQTRPGAALGFLGSSGPVPTANIDYAAGVGGMWGPGLDESPNGAAAAGLVEVGTGDTFWSSNAAEVRADTVSGGVHHVNLISSGRVFCERAQQLAQRLAPLDYATLITTAMSKYQAYLLTFAAHGVALPPGDAQAIADAQTALMHSRATSDATTDLGVAGGIVAAIPVVGQAAGIIAAGISALIGLLPTAGTVWCPQGFGYRVPFQNTCAGAIAPPKVFKPKSSNTGLIVAAGLGLGLFGLLLWKRM